MTPERRAEIEAMLDKPYKENCGDWTYDGWDPYEIVTDLLAEIDRLNATETLADIHTAPNNRASPADSTIRC